MVSLSQSRWLFLQTIGILLGISCQLLIAAEEPTAVAKMSTTAKVSKLMELTSYGEMQTTISNWKRDKSEMVRREIIVDLLSRLTSMRKLSLDTDKSVYVITSGMRKFPPSDRPHVGQDVFCEGGRSAWAIERLFDIRLPEFLGTMPAKDVAEATRTTMFAVIRMMRLPDYMNVANAPVETRIAIASSSNIPVRVLSTLAADNDPRVRLAVANHPLGLFIPGFIALRKDKDEDVRRAAIRHRNASHSVLSFDMYNKKFDFSSTGNKRSVFAVPE